MRKMTLIISNVKLSAKIPEKPLHKIKQNCIDQSIAFSTHNNFIVFRSSNFTYIIFKKNLLKNCDENSEVRQHTNITVRNISDIQEAITLMKKILQLDDNVYVPFKIDNLTATASICKQVDVQTFLNKTKHISKQISFNPEKFPAIFIKHSNGTVLLFKSGVMNILGCKSMKELTETHSWICEICAYI